MWMPVVTRTPFWTIVPFKKKKNEASWLGFPSLKDISVGVLFPRNSDVESWTVASPYIFHWMLAHFLDRVCVTPYLLESIINFWSSNVRNLHCFFSFALILDLGCTRARGGLFKLSLTKREMLRTN